MEPFSLEKYLENPSRKVVTRDGRPVRILCTDAKAKDGCCIIAAIETDGEEEGYQFFKNGKAYSSKSSIEDCADLFFADEELTEFDYAVLSIISDHNSHTDSIEAFAKRSSKKLLDLAKKELETSYYTKVLDDRMVFKSDLHDRDMQGAYELGKQDALKNLPKWKKCDDNLPYSHIGGLNERYLIKNGYCIKISDLETLQKEE